jgi:hypothetical protein
VASGLHSQHQVAIIPCTSVQVQLATSLFPCQQVDFLVKYLGMPLVPTKLPKVAPQPLLDQVADHLPVWKGHLMRRSGQLILIRTTLFAVPMHTLICLGLPPWLHKALQWIITAFL